MRGTKLIHLGEYFINGISFHIEAVHVYYSGNVAFYLYSFTLMRPYIYITFHPLINTALRNCSLVVLNAHYRIKEQDIARNVFELNSTN